jgi:hypothetical protein
LDPRYSSFAFSGDSSLSNTPKRPRPRSDSEAEEAGSKKTVKKQKLADPAADSVSAKLTDSEADSPVKRSAVKKAKAASGTSGSESESAARPKGRIRRALSSDSD